MQQQVRNQDQQAEPQIIIKGIEVKQFEAMLDEFPHSVAKTVIAFINSCQTKRNQERAAAAQKEKTAQEWTNMNETIEKQNEELALLRNFKESSENNKLAAKSCRASETATGLPGGKLNVDEGDE